MLKRLTLLGGLSCFALLLAAQRQLTISNPSSCPLNFTLSDNNCPENGFSTLPDEVRVVVQNAPGTALGQDVALSEVRLIVDHSWVGDLSITLSSPSGIDVQLIANTGGEGDDLGDPADLSCGSYTRFGLGACGSIAAAEPPFTDELFRPLEDLQSLHDGATDPNGTWRLFICDDLPTDVGTLRFVELVFQPLTCIPLPPPRVVAIDTTSVALDIGGGNNCDLVFVEVGSPGFQPGTGATTGPDGSELFILSCTDAVLTGLDPEREYEAYARRFCDADNDYADNSCPVRFTTGCRPGPLTQLTDFDSLATCGVLCGASCPIDGFWRNAFGDAGDWFVGAGPTPTSPGTGPPDDFPGGGRYLYLEANGAACAEGEELFFQSGCFVYDPRGTDDCHFSFAYHMAGIDIGRLRLQASTNGGAGWTTLWERSGGQGSQWRKAYISLAQFTAGDTLQLRFGANRTDGPYGDIALDELRLHGSTVLGVAESRFFADADGDGFGDAARPLLTCRSTPPAGYADNDADCDDSDPGINPAAAEIPCNGVDENCNATTIDDDPFLPEVAVTNDTVCGGTPPLLRATPQPGYLLFWYTDSVGGQLINVGATYEPQLPAPAADRVYRYYVEATNTICRSVRRTEVSALVLARPEIVLPPVPNVCFGDSLLLDTLGVDDANQTSATLRYYRALPPGPASELTSTEIALENPFRLYLQFTTAAGCTDLDSLDLAPVAGPEVALFPADSFAICVGTTTDLTAQATGGTAPYQYGWQNGSTEATLRVAAGPTPGAVSDYVVTVTDANGCATEGRAEVRSTGGLGPVQITSTPVTSCGGSDGRFTLTPLAGQPPFAYQWTGNNGQNGSGVSTNNSFEISELRQGTYSISITESTVGNCATILRNQRVQGPGFSVDDVAIEPPSCAEAGDGQICIQLGGTATAGFSWSDGQTTACAENLAPGPYAVTISNGNCTTVESFTLTAPVALRARGTTRPASCFDATDGTATLVPLGGTAPYTYSWSNGETEGRIENLSAGDYGYTLTDANGCRLVDSLRVTAPDSLRLVTLELSSIGCSGQGGGRIQLLPEGGNPPFQLLWSDGGLGALRENLPAGTYAVSLTDAIGCQISRSYDITEPDELGLALANREDPICLGDPSGSIELQVSGGTAPVQLAWSDGTLQSETLRAGLTSGRYWVFAIDANNCRSDTLFVDLSPQSQPTLSIQQTQPTCVGLNDGRIEIIPGANGPYEFLWADGNTTPVLADVPAGSYPVRVTTGQGCVIDTTIALAAPQVFDIVSTPIPPSCFGASDGIIDQIFLQQGAGPFQFFWNDGSQHVKRFNLGPGDYSFTVTDTNGCQFYSDTFHLVEPPRLTIEVRAQGDSNCENEPIGFVETAVSGGTPPYQYNWLGTGVTGPDIYQLAPGDYQLRVTDERGCVRDRIVTIADAPPFSAEIQVRRGDACVAGLGDTLVAVPFGGAGPFTYRWSDGATGAMRINPPGGGYRVAVSDSRGCEIVTPTIKLRPRPTPLQLDSIRSFPPLCAGDTASRIEVYTSGGGELLRYHFTPTYIVVTDSNRVDYLNPPGNSSYSVTVTDLTTGCTVSSGGIAMNAPPAIALTATLEAGVTCLGGNDGRIRGLATGGVPPFAYLWTNGAGDTLGQSSVLIQAPVGELLLSVVDANGCSASLGGLQMPLANPPIEFQDSLTQIDNPRCRGIESGRIAVTVTGGQPPLQYAWSNGATTAEISNLAAGAYLLTVTDAAGCTFQPDTFLVTQPDSAFLIPSVLRNERCPGTADGFIRLSPSGGTRPYVLSWRRDGLPFTPADRANLTGLGAGTYTLVARDAAGCVKRDTFSITAPPAAELTFATSGDTLRVVVTGGTPPFDYQWSTGSQDSLLTGLNPGTTYGVTVTEANDCATEAQFTITATREAAALAGLTVFPNPVADDVGVSWPGSDGRLFRLRVTDLTGRVYWTSPAGLPLAKATYLPTRGLPAGVYLLSVYERGQLLGTRRLVKF